MREFSIEWLYALIFVAVTLYQYWRNRRSLPDLPETSETSDASAGKSEMPEQPLLPSPSQMSLSHTLAAGGDGDESPRLRAISANGTEHTGYRTHRYSRRALFSDRADTQVAVVAAVILGPCRSLSPYDTRQ